MLSIRLYILRHYAIKTYREMKFPFIDILLKLFWFIVISKIIRFSRYRYYLLWNLAHCYIGIEIPFFYSIYSIFKFYLNTKNITIIIKRIKASVNIFAVLHWITASRFTKRTTSYSSLIRSSSSTTAYRFLQLKPKTGELLIRVIQTKASAVATQLYTE